MALPFLGMFCAVDIYYNCISDVLSRDLLLHKLVNSLRIFNIHCGHCCSFLLLKNPRAKRSIELNWTRKGAQYILLCSCQPVVWVE